MYKELPQFTKDFYKIRTLVWAGMIQDLSTIGEEYWKQPEWFPKFEKIGVPSKIKTLDDLFFYRYFSSNILKESNVYKSSNRLTEGSPQKAERIEFSIIEKEHDIWISLTKKP